MLPPSLCNSIHTTILIHTRFACPKHIFASALPPLPPHPNPFSRRFLLHCTACSLAVLPESWGFITSGSSGGLEKASILRGSKASSVIKTDTVSKSESPKYHRQVLEMGTHHWCEKPALLWLEPEAWLSGLWSQSLQESYYLQAAYPPVGWDRLFTKVHHFNSKVIDKLVIPDYY